VEQRSVDLTALRGALRRLPRGQLLMIAGRAIELMPDGTLNVLLRDFLKVPHLDVDEIRIPTLLDQVRMFHDASLRGDYYESFAVDSKNCTEQSSGTDAFIAEFDRLMDKALHSAADNSRSMALAAFELLLALLRRIDEDPDSVVFFADEAGAWQIPVHWKTMLPVYFRCLAESTPAEAFANTVDGAITDHCNHQRPQLLAAAQSVANAEQQAALQRWAIRDGSP
jgi:hypothetical protein